MVGALRGARRSVALFPSAAFKVLQVQQQRFQGARQVLNLRVRVSRRSRSLNMPLDTETKRSRRGALGVHGCSPNVEHPFHVGLALATSARRLAVIVGP